MTLPEHTPLDAGLGLPEEHLLRDSDRLQDYAGAFLRGEITAVQYSDLTLAEISRRAPMDPMEPPGDPQPPVVLHEDPPIPPASATRPPRSRPRRSRTDDRPHELADAFVGGRMSGPDFLRLIRDC